MMVVMRHTAVLDGKTADGPVLFPQPAVAMLIGEQPEAKHAAFIGRVRGLALAFIAKSGPYEEGV